LSYAGGLPDPCRIVSTRGFPVKNGDRGFAGTLQRIPIKTDAQATKRSNQSVFREGGNSEKQDWQGAFESNWQPADDRSVALAIDLRGQLADPRNQFTMFGPRLSRFKSLLPAKAIDGSSAPLRRRPLLDFS